MDYEKKYKEALERAKAFEEKFGGGYAEYIFPELKESEDERMIRKIEMFLSAYGADYFSNDEWREIEDWLEKQKDIWGERAQNITANMLEDGIEGIQRELIEFLSNTVNASWIDIIRSADAYTERIRNIIEKQKEQKPVEWGEDEKTRKWIVNFLHGLHYNQMEQPMALKAIEYLEKQKEQKPISQEDFDVAKHEALWGEPKQEWSEEDEAMRNNIISVLSVFVGTVVCDSNPSLSSSYPTYRREIAWLKSLRPSWKPSEEQMEALKRTMQLANFGIEEDRRKALISLYEQLKRIKED